MEDELQYVYTNPEGRMIFTPVYKKYQKYFFDQVLDNSNLKMAFGEFRDTGVYERYMQNIAQFSAAKNMAETRLMQSELFDGHKIKSFDKFHKDVADIVQVQQETWLRVEYETCRRNVVAGSAFATMQDNVEAFPYWIWEGRMDKRERPDHVAMEGKVFRIGDPNGDKCFPPADWNCRCRGVPIDDMYLQEKNFKVSTPAEAKRLMEENVAENFRYNPAIQGPMPKEHSYFDVFPNANHGDADTFGLENLGGPSRHAATLAGKRLQYIIEMVHDWRRDYHVDNRHNLVFQNKATFANVRLTDATITEIAKYPMGMEQLPKAIEHPTEIWGTWEDTSAQMVVLRTYILVGKTNYVVNTRDGKVVNAFAASSRQVNKLRKGVILY